jgi:Fur family ferric uptake transcriptional regulator
MGRATPIGTDWVSTLRARGYRLTPQRQLVLEAVGALGHATPEEIAVAVQEKAAGLNISTVYRTLELLEELGLVRHTHLGHGAPAYSIADDHQHVHLKCSGCGRVQEVSPALFAPTVATLLEEQGFEVDIAHFAVFGRCRDCRSD